MNISFKSKFHYDDDVFNNWYHMFLDDNHKFLDYNCRVLEPNSLDQPSTLYETLDEQTDNSSQIDLSLHLELDLLLK